MITRARLRWLLAAGIAAAAVADTYDNRIVEFTSTGSFVRSFGSLGTGNGQLDTPAGISVSGSTGDVYVADAGNNRTEEFSATGTFVRAWGSYGSGVGQFDFP